MKKLITLLAFTPLLFSFNFKNNSLASKKISFDENMNRSVSEDKCIKAYLENLFNDTHAIKFYNKCDTGYRVFYQVTDKGKIIQETSSVYVRANSGNSPGTIHCSPEAVVKIIRKEAF